MKRVIPEKKPSICNCLNLRRAYRSISKIYENCIAPSGLTPNQFSLLAYLKRLGPITISDLALEIRLDRTTLVRNVKPLERELLVDDISKKGSRNHQLQLTEKGIKRFEEARLHWSKAQAFMEQKLGRDNLEKLTALLSMIENLES